MIKTCQQCNKEFNAKNNKVKYCCKQCYSDNMTKIKTVKCPVCENEFKQTHTTQKYCSRKCSDKSREEVHNILTCPTCNKEFNKNKTKTDKYCSKKCYDKDNKLEIITKTCKKCGKEFETKRVNAIYCSTKCRNEDVAAQKKQKPIRILKNEISYVCKQCGKEIKSKYAKRVFCSVECRGNWFRSEEGRKEQSQKMIGKPSPNKGKKLSEKTKRKISQSTREGMKKAMDKKGENWQPFFNKQAAEYFLQFDKNKNTNGQHALNGGERRIYNQGSIFLDYINDELKLIIEYDEPHHAYRQEEDLDREKRIKEELPEYQLVRIDDNRVNCFEDFMHQVDLSL
jgi:hypothetical protein